MTSKTAEMNGRSSDFGPRLFWLPMGLLPFSISAWAADPADARADVRTRLDFRVSAVVDMHYYVRALADRENVPIEYAEAVNAVRELNDALQNAMAWGFIESNLEGCRTFDDVIREFGDLPESSRLFGGRRIQLRSLAINLATAAGKAFPAFEKEVWPQHETSLATARKRIDADLMSKQAECFSFMFEKLGIIDPGVEIPVHLVVDAPFPEAFTHRRVGGGGMCFVGVANAPGSQLYESILHEATHVLDIASEDRGVFVELRGALSQAGVSRRDAVYRDLPHTLMFVQAGETIRRIVNPDHQHYGDVAEYYQRVGPVSEIVRKHWTSYLDGQMSREDAVAKMVEEAVPPGEK